jgi:tRNA modification GTPase
VRLFDDDGPFDEGLLTWMPGPGSYTGEDCAEISCHGNPLLVERLLAACVAAGCRPALPGEFTRRAHAHGRLDLVRAEAVLQAIEARSAAGLEVASRALRGELGRWVASRRETLRGLGAELEARLDFPDQLDQVVPDGPRLQDDEALCRRLGEAEAALLGAARTYRRSNVQVRGARVALVGPINAGKSSLFNAWSAPVPAPPATCSRPAPSCTACPWCSWTQRGRTSAPGPSSGTAWPCGTNC